MHIGSGLNTVSSLYGQQKGNQMKTPASGEKTFYTAETPKVYQIFTYLNPNDIYIFCGISFPSMQSRRIDLRFLSLAVSIAC
jgi:hypothetical protein